jgi:hypothetical protein
MRRAIWRVASLASGERLAAAAQGAHFLCIYFIAHTTPSTENREPRTGKVSDLKGRQNTQNRERKSSLVYTPTIHKKRRRAQGTKRAQKRTPRLPQSPARHHPSHTPHPSALLLCAAQFPLSFITVSVKSSEGPQPINHPSYNRTKELLSTLDSRHRRSLLEVSP